MEKNIKEKNINKEHYDLDVIYELSIIYGIILSGITDAVNKCEKYKGSPFCIPPEEIIKKRFIKQNFNKQQGGSDFDESSKRLAELREPPTIEKLYSFDGKTYSFANNSFNDSFMNFVQTINNKFVSIFGSSDDMKKNITDFLIQNKEIVKQITHDPEVQNALREWVREVGIMNIQLLDMAKPTLDQLVDKSMQALDEIATKATRGLMSTSLNILEAFVGEIPVAGGIIDIVIAFMRGFNSAMQAAAPGVEFGTEAFFTALITAFNMFDMFKTEGEKLRQATRNMKGAVEHISDDLYNSLQVTPNDLKNFEKKGKEIGDEYIRNTLTKLPSVPMSDTKLIDTKLIDPKLIDTKLIDQKLSQKNIAQLDKLKEKNTNITNKFVSGGGLRYNIRKRIKYVTKRLNNTISSFMNNKHRNIIYKNLNKTKKIHHN